MPVSVEVTRVSRGAGARLRLGALMLSTCTAALLAASPASAELKSCPTPSSTTDQNCTINSGDAVSGAAVTFTGATSTREGDNGGAGGTYELTNNRSISTSATSTQSSVLLLRLNGGMGFSDSGKDGSRGGDAGTVTVTNNASLSFGGQPSASADGSIDGSIAGVWDTPGFASGISVIGVGGRGGNSEAGVGGGDGGPGGLAGQVQLYNFSSVNLNMVLPFGGAGLFGSAVSGAGGDQDDTAGDQVGGNAGDGRRQNGSANGRASDLPGLYIENSGAVSVSSGSAGGFVWGIGAEGIGNIGGRDNGSGGEGTDVQIISTGPVTVNAEGSDGFSRGVRGIYAASVGGAGVFSSDGSDSGGRGEEGKEILVTVSEDVTVTSNSVAAPNDVYVPATQFDTNRGEPDTDAPVYTPDNLGALQQSGGVVLYSRGGDGGTGPQTIAGNSPAGTGAQASARGTGSSIGNGTTNLTVDNGAAIRTFGDNIPGVVVFSYGGLGGTGREDSNGADGGFGGNVEFNFEDSASIATTGASSPGVLIRSAGGPGGDYIPSSGVIDVSPNRAGSGADGGQILLEFGVFFTDPAGSDGRLTGIPSITTSGANSPGVVAQTVGGQGGRTGDSFQLLGQSGSTTGNGGDGGRIGGNIGVDISTTGDFSRGIVLQALGNSGGLGGTDSGFAVVGGAAGVGGDTSDISFTLVPNVTTTGDSATALLAQAIGGGGGTADGVGGVVAVGGQGGTGGNGGPVTLDTIGGALSTGGDYAYGIVAQSVGGGGGDGGSAFSISVGSVPAVGVGGAGGVAGNGGASTVTTDRTVSFEGDDQVPPLSIATRGANAHAVVAQSVGGGGGSGGDATGGGLTPASFQMAGGAKSGGNGAASTVKLTDASVTTTGSHASGIVAQSVGGGGGTGGSAFSFTADLGFALSVGVGGLGGNGGAGNRALVTLDGTTVTTGSDDQTDSHGIVAQTVGGGGGMGGSSVARAVAKAVSVPDTDASIGFAAAASLGGRGGTGGNASNFGATTSDPATSVTLSGATVTTRGDGSMGIIAQSVGGGGGIGGSASSAAGVRGTDEGSISATVSAALGGSGGTAGAGSIVGVTLDGSSRIETFGDHANAILAQSVGGGGGAAGTGSASTTQAPDGYSASATIGLGAPGGVGSPGGQVTANLASGSTIVTHGSGSRGFIAQSVGGGGGVSQGGTIGVAGSGTEKSGTVTVSVGLNGASGGGGAGITSTAFGNITTSGGDADAILVQSIGGGGGIAGSAAGDAGSDEDGGVFNGGDEDTDYSMTVAVGGTGGTGANGGTIVHNQGNGARVSTSGDWADGLVIQSIGGGGGAGGSSVADGSDGTADIDLRAGGPGGNGGIGGAITLDINGNGAGSITTTGYGAQAILLQSVGGGGGQAGDGSRRATGTLRLGGNGNSGNNETGGAITVNDYHNLTTRGDDASGLVAQSIGGGGGIVGAGSAAAADDAGSHSVGLTLGGASASSGGATNDGGNVSINFGSSLNTSGDRSMGIVAQSIGGGGGIAFAGSHDGIASATLGNGYGDGGTVDLTFRNGSLRTTGAGAHGLVAQSIGGGGGIAGDASWSQLSATPFQNGTFATAGGNGGGGNVTVTVNAPVTTTGARAFGVIAQSIGGGGGFGGTRNGTFAGRTGQTGAGGNSNAGVVTITQNAAVSATGEDSVAIFGQSSGVDDMQGVRITVNSAVTGGSGSQGAGILVGGGRNAGIGGTASQLTVNVGGSVTALSGVAIRYQADNDSGTSSGLPITNNGTIDGSIEGFFANGSTIPGFGTASAVVALAETQGPAVDLVNAEGGLLTGAEVYHADVVNAGTLVVGTEGDRRGLDIAGDFVQREGGTTVADAHFTLGESDAIRVDGRAELAGTLSLRPVSVQLGTEVTVLTAGEGIAGAFGTISSELFDFSARSIGNQLRVLPTAFTGDRPGLGLSADQGSVSRYLRGVFGEGSTVHADLFGTLDASAGAGTYAATLSGLQPGASLAAAASGFEMSWSRFDAISGCPDFSGSGVERSETCVQLLGSARRIDQDATDGAFGYDGSVFTGGVAGQAAVGEGWTVAGTLGVESVDFSGAGGFGASDGQSVVAGLGTTYRFGDFSVSAAVTGSFGTFDTDRRIAATGERARGEYDAVTIAGRLGAAYEIDLGGGYLRPGVDLDMIHVSADGYTERGAAIAGLTVADSDGFAVVATPSVEAGTTVELVEGLGIRAWGRVGVSVSSLDGYDATARFTSASTGGGFESTVAVSDVVGRVSAGLDLVGSETFDLRVGYDGAIGRDLTGHAVSLSATFRF